LTIGDYHPGNFLLSDRGLLAIDLEFTHVGCAVNDLAYVLHWLPHATRSTSSIDKRIFLSAYIEAITNQPPAAEDIDLLLFDAETARIRVLHAAAIPQCQLTMSHSGVSF
jgi:Ser/Thr protein kinase RdoA (MazF antagonist)